MKRYPLISIVLRNGVIAGVLVVVLMIILYYLGRHPLMIAPFLDFRIVVISVFMFFSLKEFREDYQKGELYFWQGLAGSWMLIVVFALTAALGLVIFGTLEKDFVSDWIVQFTDYLNGFPKEEIKRYGEKAFASNLRDVQATNISTLAKDYFLKSFLIGLPLSIIMSVILRKQPKN
jgi:hypothetical protein